MTYRLPKQIKDVQLIKAITPFMGISATWQTGLLLKLIELIEYTREASIFNMAFCVHDFIYCACETVFRLPVLISVQESKLIQIVFQWNSFFFFFTKEHYNIVEKPFEI